MNLLLKLSLALWLMAAGSYTLNSCLLTADDLAPVMARLDTSEQKVNDVLDRYASGQASTGEVLAVYKDMITDLKGDTNAALEKVQARVEAVKDGAITAADALGGSGIVTTIGGLLLHAYRNGTRKKDLEVETLRKNQAPTA